MGVPAFFRWLSQKYPSIVQHCVEKRGHIIDDDGNRAPMNLTEPNPNGEEFDNLYLDMNGIIHPCTHPENKAAPKNEAEMFISIFEYIDRLFALIRPRRVLYMAIDGVAPRAKMNQQRSRRFRAAKESQDKALTIERLRMELIAKGAKLPDPKDPSEHFDSNCITPGTPFMDRLAVALRYYIYERINSNPAWKNLQVILSDSNAPGEGEHKIMDYIRRQRQSPTHDPNTRHCLCGADADLIMLGLATHEPHFTIIREEFKPNAPRPCELCGQYGHEMEDCVGAPKEEGIPPPPGAEVEFIFIKLAVLRQYLEQDLQIPNIPFKWELERVIDDWVFMCFFVGNDFLPHLPSLEIREGAIDKLIELYKFAVSKTGGWLTDSGRVHLDRVQLIMTELGTLEDSIFKSRRDEELHFRDRKKRQQHYGQKRPSWNAPTTGVLAPVAIERKAGAASFAGSTANQPITADAIRQSRRMPNVNWVEQCLQNQEAAVSLRAMLKTGSKHKLSSNGEDEGGSSGQDDESVTPSKRAKGRLGGVDASVIKEKPQPGQTALDEDEKIDKCDEVRLWEDGWRARYYQSKFGVDPADAPEFCLKVAHEYVIGLCWVLAYYYQGCASWDWYYPYHYAPFASDFCDVASVDPGFAGKITKPFCPLEQLMGVFPAASRSHVPPAWQDLMTDPDSPIIDFYPTNFKVDLNGKRYLWMGVALLPFVDEVRLLKALDSRRSLLTAEERFRNLRRPELYFVHADSEMGKFVASRYETTDAAAANDGSKRTQKYEGLAPTHSTLINTTLTAGLAGHVWPDYDNACLPGHSMPSGVPNCLPAIPAVQQRAISVFFANPEYPFGHVFPAVLLDSVTMPPSVNLLPPTLRGRGRGNQGGPGRMGNNARHSFDGQQVRSRSYGRDDSSNDRRNSYRSQSRNSFPNTPADRMIRQNLPRYDDHNPQLQQNSTYPPVYPPPYNSQQFGNPYFPGPPNLKPQRWNNPPTRNYNNNYQNRPRGGRGGRRGYQYGWQPPRGSY